MDDVAWTHGSHVAATPQLRWHDMDHRRHDSYSFCVYFPVIINSPSTSETTLFLTKMCVRNTLFSPIHENIDG
jgi:hypothetical protein